MSKKKTTKATTFQVTGKPAKGKARAHLIVAVYPNGAIGIACVENGVLLEDAYRDARSDAEDVEFNDLIGDEGTRNENIAFYRVDLELAKPVVKPVRPPKVAKAKITHLESPPSEDEAETDGFDGESEVDED